MSSSRISGLYRLTVRERIDELEHRGVLSSADAELLRQGRHVLTPPSADRIIENVVGVFGLPLAIAPNFIVNGKAYLVPMVVEEPSIVAATSNAAKLAAEASGFESRCDESLLAGQIHLTGIVDIGAATKALQESKDELLVQANDVHPRLVERGGGVRDIDVRRIGNLLAVHILVDTCDAMGANLVNTVCESVAPKVAEICGGDVALRILSNLIDRSLVSATVRYRLEDLDAPGMTPAEVRDRVVTASDIAQADPYRAATHNKGIMNGIDALAVATGNDWRAIEAGAHAYAARAGGYAPLATWSTDAEGDLKGEIRLPLKVGIVGGTMAANPAASLALRISGVESARELAELMAAVGLAQNFAAIRALATEGIQRGHMRLHARSAAAGRPAVAKAVPGGEELASAAGKVILLGEHAVVYGKHALALPINEAVSASVAKSSQPAVTIPEWGVEEAILNDSTQIGAAVFLILRELGLDKDGYAIRMHSSLPRGMGLGSSAALAVAIVRAFDRTLDLGLDNEKVNRIAFACEQLAHGTPSGVDNAIATYGVPMLFRNADTLQIDELELAEPPSIVIAFSNQSGATKEQVEGVRQRREKQRERFDAIFDEIDALSLAGAKSLEAADYEELGALMNLCHGLLNAIGVSNAELEAMVGIARAAGAVGAKLTGAGGGGSIVALCPERIHKVADAFDHAGFSTLILADKGKTKIG